MIYGSFCLSLFIQRSASQDLFLFSSPYSARHCLHLWRDYNVFRYHEPSSCDDLISHFLRAIVEQFENDGWKTKVGVKKVLLYTGQCGNKDWCVGYWFPARILWVTQSRRELIEMLLLKRIQNVPLLRWTDNSGLINKALLLNKNNERHTSLNILCARSV